MNVGIVGFGIQGKKRARLFKTGLKFIHDPYLKNKKFKYLNKTELKDVASIFLCIPDKNKIQLIKKFLKLKKNILVEKPLMITNKEANEIERLSKNKNFVYVAYNHRFEPNIINIKKYLDKKIIGQIYKVNIFYGNGTSLLVKKSKWKDKGEGVLSDLGSHIIDILIHLFPSKKFNYNCVDKNNFENKSLDSVFFKSTNNKVKVYCEASLLSWKNKFTIDLYGKKGSIHMDGLCKWGTSLLTLRKRKYPSGVPLEKIKKINSKDPTWKKEHYFFKNVLNYSEMKKQLKKSLFITSQLKKLIRQN